MVLQNLNTHKELQPNCKTYCHIFDTVTKENFNSLFYDMFMPFFQLVTRSPAIAEGPRDAGVPVEIW